VEGWIYRTTPEEFSRIARKYDTANLIMSLGLVYPVLNYIIKKSEVKEGGVVADIGCGTGSLSKFLLKKNIKVLYGVEPSQDMLAIAIKNIRDNRFVPIVGVGESVPLPSSSLDAIFSSFVLRNVHSLGDFARENFRLLRSGGTFLHIEFCVPPSPFSFFFKLYLKGATYIAGKFIAGEPGIYRKFAKSIINFPSPAQIKNIFMEAGLIANVKIFAGVLALHMGYKK